jgi:ATP-binding cassette subfamily F protein 3
VIRFNQFSLARGTKPLFDQTTFTLNPGEKAGLVGANGAGKSTLFAVLLGELHADAGDFAMPPSWQIAHVAQETPAVDKTALAYTLDGDAALRAIEAAIAAASAAHDGAAEGEAHAAFADADGYTAPARAEALLLGLGFTLEQTRLPVASFSGGWRMRLNLAQALMCRSDLLLLDEPTNHLDLDAIVWLEDWLHRYPGTLIVISHDREFLDSVCNVTLHLEHQQIKRYGGNYSQFEILRAQQIALQQSAYEKQQRTVEHLQSYINRFKAQATKARQAQSRVKALEKMELIAPAHASSPFTFEFRTPDSAPNPMMVMEGVRCGYRNENGEIPIVEHVTQPMRTARANRRSSRRLPARSRRSAATSAKAKGYASAISRSISSRRYARKTRRCSIWRGSRRTRASRNCATSSAASTSPGRWRRPRLHRSRAAKKRVSRSRW